MICRTSAEFQASTISWARCCVPYCVLNRISSSNSRFRPINRAGNSVEGHIRVARNATEYHGMLLLAWTGRWRSTRSWPASDIDHRCTVWVKGNDLKRPARHAQVIESVNRPRIPVTSANKAMLPERSDPKYPIIPGTSSCSYSNPRRGMHTFTTTVVLASATDVRMTRCLLSPTPAYFASAASRNASALSVRSQVNSSPVRPKCPYAAVLR